MEAILRKRDNETQWEYGLRIIESKIDGEIDLEWQDIVELLDLDVHRDSLRKATNVTPYSGVAVAKYYKQKIEEMMCQQGESDTNIQSLIDELETKKIELMKEKVKLQDQRRQYHSLIRTEARWEALLDLIKAELTKLPSLHWDKPQHQFIDNSHQASLLLSDWHIGSYINTPHNKFSTEVAKERVEKLKFDTLSYCKIHNVTTLNVNLMGDLISGIIHVTTRLHNQENVVKQVVLCSELLADLINDLANEIQFVNVNYTIGNHGRVSANVKESLDSENFEYLILEFLKVRLVNAKNINFNTSDVDKEIVTYETYNGTVAIVHGHRERKMFESTKELSHFLGKKIDIVMMGHFHNFAVKNNVIVNGCLSGADEYANNLRFNNDPSQTLVIHFENGNKALYEIILK